MQVVSTCLARDLPIYRLTYESLRRNLPNSEIHVITRREDFGKFRNRCGDEIVLWNEDELIPKMTLTQLKGLPLPFFPRGAGWYFQQFLKYAFLSVSNRDEHYLIWDADTVLLRPIEFFDEKSRPYYTKADEYHVPYFETFEALFGAPAHREFSYISQHQVIEKPLLREMLSEIERRYPNYENWAWAIIDNLRGRGTNLFSEYETYGHYARMRAPESVVFRELPWIRSGSLLAGYPPSRKMLRKLADHYAFAAFEASESKSRRISRWIRRLIPDSIP